MKPEIKIYSLQIVVEQDPDPILADTYGSYSDEPGIDAIDCDSLSIQRVAAHCRYFNPAQTAAETGNPDSPMQDYRRMEAYYCGEWQMLSIGVKAVVVYNNANGDCRLETLSSGYVFGVESDSDKEDMKSLAKDQLGDMIEHLTVFGVNVSNFDELAFKALASWGNVVKA